MRWVTARCQADFSRGVRRETSRGTRVGLTFSSTTSRVITTRSTSLRLGTSYITRLRTSSRVPRTAPGTGAPQVGLVGDRVECVRGELQVDAVQLEESLVLLDEGVAGLGEDLDERL